MKASDICISVPRSDIPFLRKMAKAMGWTITPARKKGIDLGLEDIEAGRVHHAANAQDMLTQILG